MVGAPGCNPASTPLIHYCDPPSEASSVPSRCSALKKWSKRLFFLKQSRNKILKDRDMSLASCEGIFPGRGSLLLCPTHFLCLWFLRHLPCLRALTQTEPQVLAIQQQGNVVGLSRCETLFSFLFSLSLVSNSTLHTPYKFTPRTRLTRRSCNVLYIPCYYITVRDDYPVLVLLFCPTLDALCFVIRASSDTSSRSNPCSPPFFAPLFIQNLKLFRSLLSP